ncbi:DUF6134 family protein [Belliella kenyensis]|uniref:DUF6134 family protein n=1 Tax=Belliella kenyensis TaxID=1472724 RepID=A0ABV8ELS2_9BACT|nr:DUF6134 family protein [Belliella kenyensis]MCH7400394.1 hypothetical protein [Belliella kenyensis]MDN3604588.1 hypothetical protein [Belliella kenyensis]
MLFSQNSICIGQAETIHFDITVAGISIGEMKAYREVSLNKEFYDLQSKVSFWFFGRVNLDYSIKSEFDGKKLKRANSKTNSNKGDFASSIVWKDDKYHVKATSYQFENDTTFYRPFLFSSSKMFFEEPVEIDLSIAENFGLPAKVTKMKDYYEVSVNGNKNKFYYENGKIVKAVMQSPVKNYVIKRKPD